MTFTETTAERPSPASDPDRHLTFAVTGATGRVEELAARPLRLAGSRRRLVRVRNAAALRRLKALAHARS